MVHLSNNKNIVSMFFYSVLTFILGPYIVRYIKGDNSTDPRSCIPGFLLGFTVSIFLWDFYSER